MQLHLYGMCSVHGSVKDDFLLFEEVRHLSKLFWTSLLKCHVISFYTIRKDGMINPEDTVANKIYCLCIAEVLAEDIFMSWPILE